MAFELFVNIKDIITLSFVNIKDIITLSKIKRKYLSDCVRLELILKTLTKDKLQKEKEIDNLKKNINIEKERIYQEIKKFKIQNNKLVCLKTTEIEINTDKKTIVDKILSLIPFIKKTIYDVTIIGLYINNGVAKIINIPQITGGTTSILNKEMYNIEDYSDAPYLNGKKLIFINNKTIFNPRLDIENKKFMFNISPEYYWRLNNNTFDYNLTIPKTENKGMDMKKILIILAIIGVALYFLSQKKS
jgi:hypothetical protein